MLEEKRCAPERNHDLNELFGLMRDVVRKLDSVSKRVEEVASSLESHMTDELIATREQTRSIEELGRVFKAFPHDEDGEPDIRGHRKDHETRMVGARDSGLFWRRIKEEIGKNLVMAIMVLFALGINSYIQHAATGNPSQMESRK